MRSINRKRYGFTLIEAVMVIALIGIISVGIGSFILTATQAWVLITGREAAINTSRTAMNRMTAEMRRIMRPSAIIVANPAECQFTDLDGQTIDYRQDGANLMRNADILAAGLETPSGLAFTYLDGSGEVTAVVTNVRSIRVRLSLVSGTQRAALESSARIRNL